MEKTNQPLYQQLMEDVRSQIENSLLLPGDKLPTEREFMQKYNVSRITVSKALNELKTEGLITRFPNKGSFVARSASPLAAAAQVPLEAPSALLPASASAQLPAVPGRQHLRYCFYRNCLYPAVHLRSVFFIYGKRHTFCISHGFLYLSPFPELQSFSGKPAAAEMYRHRHQRDRSVPPGSAIFQ